MLRNARRAAVAAVGPGRSMVGTTHQQQQLQQQPQTLQARYATRVGFFKRRRKLKCPITWDKKPIMMREDTRSQSHFFYMWAWHYTLKRWRANFENITRHLITEFEITELRIPSGMPQLVVRKMMQVAKGEPLLSNRRMDYRDNPFMKDSYNWVFKQEHLTKIKGRSSTFLKEGKTQEEASQLRKDSSAKMRAELEKHKKKGGVIHKARSLHVSGQFSVHHAEMEKKMKKDAAILYESGEGSDDADENTRPRRATQYFELDPDTAYKKILTKPKMNVESGPRFLHPIVDAKYEVEPGEEPVRRVSSAGSGYIHTGTTSLPSDFAYPIELEVPLR